MEASANLSDGRLIQIAPQTEQVLKELEEKASKILNEINSSLAQLSAEHTQNDIISEAARESASTLHEKVELSLEQGKGIVDMLIAHREAYLQGIESIKSALPPVATIKEHQVLIGQMLKLLSNRSVTTESKLRSYIGQVLPFVGIRTYDACIQEWMQICYNRGFDDDDRKEIATKCLDCDFDKWGKEGKQLKQFFTLISKDNATPSLIRDAARDAISTP